MVPQRLRLSGFLSYREPREIDFSTARLWLLAGPNGAGKSAVFDAITWALYGTHRAGSTAAAELIHKGGDRCEVDLHFQLLGADWRIVRTLKLTKSGTSGSLGVFRAIGEEWEPVEGTQKKAGFDDWIERNVRLTFEAFTASALLRQGKAEALLDAAPKARAEILASAVHLERVQRLAERANAERLKQKAIVDALEQQRDLAPMPSAEEEAAATAKRELCERIGDDLKGMIAKTEDRLAAALKAESVRERLIAAREELVKAQLLQTEAEAVKKDHDTLTELTAVLPLAETVVVTHAKRTESEHRTERTAKQKDESTQHRERLLKETTLAKAKRQQLAKALADDEAALSAALKRLRDIAGHIQTLKLIEEQTADLARLDASLTALPATAELPTRHAEYLAAQQAAQQLPALEQAVRAVGERDAAMAQQHTAKEAAERIRADGETAKQEHERTQKDFDNAKAKLAALEAERTAAAVNHQVAVTAVASAKNLTGKPQCDACGQAMTEAHRCAVLAEREVAAKEAAATLDTLNTDVARLQSQRDELEAKAEHSRERLHDLRQQYREQQSVMDAAAKEVARCQAIIGTHGVATYDTVKQAAAKLPALQATVQALTAQDAQRKALDNQKQTALNSLARLKATLPPGTLKDEQLTLQAEETARTQAVKAGRQGLEQLDRDLDRLERESHKVLEEVTALTGRLKAEAETQAYCGEVIDRAMSKLSPEWQMRVNSAGLADYNTWKDSERTLIANRTAERFQELQGSPWTRRAEDVRSLEAEVATLEPDGVATVKERLQSLRTRQQVNESELATARALERQHAAQAEARAGYDAKALVAEREWARWKRLADLLGRDGLQRHLMREAEQAIVASANATLAKSGIALKLAEATEAEKALDLTAVVNGVTLEVPFLSGSQKFRVAVALALGLGAFAARSQPACLMIDEGFGSLDTDGRKVMIEELHALAGSLPRIIVVNHDAEFAAAFTNAWEFTLDDGATRVRKR